MDELTKILVEEVLYDKFTSNEEFAAFFHVFYRSDRVVYYTDLKTNRPDLFWILNRIQNTGVDVNRLRAQLHDKGYILIVDLHPEAETIKSYAWLICHEMGHMYLSYFNRVLGFDLFGRLSGTPLSEMTEEEYYEYCYNDLVHSSRLDEIFCNTLATKVIGADYGRSWWKEKLKKPEEK